MTQYTRVIDDFNSLEDRFLRRLHFAMMLAYLEEEVKLSAFLSQES